MFSEIPLTPPDTPLLSAVDADRSVLNGFDKVQLEQLAEELRAYLLYSVGQSGGHFGAGLGVVELTVALHYVFNTPEDRIVWDVGHQTYPHKILTGRMQQMHTMRHAGGLSGFPKRSESEYDTFGVGHSSTSISAAMGMALAARQQGSDRKAIAVIGDGAITGGMAYEAMNNAGASESRLIVVLNDNEWSISRSVGALAKYLSRIRSNRVVQRAHQEIQGLLQSIPLVGKKMDQLGEVLRHAKASAPTGDLTKAIAKVSSATCRWCRGEASSAASA